jgi:hypothetical protein
LPDVAGTGGVATSMIRVILPEPERAHDAPAHLLGVVVHARRERHGAHRCRLDVPLAQGLDPALVGVEDVLDQLELGVDDRRLTFARRVDLPGRHDLAAGRRHDRVPRPARRQVEQHRAEPAIEGRAVVVREHLGLRWLLGREEREADGLGEQARFGEGHTDPVDLRAAGHGERMGGGLGRVGGRVAPVLDGGHTVPPCVVGESVVKDRHRWMPPRSKVGLRSRESRV